MKTRYRDDCFIGGLWPQHQFGLSTPGVEANLSSLNLARGLMWRDWLYMVSSRIRCLSNKMTQYLDTSSIRLVNGSCAMHLLRLAAGLPPLGSAAFATETWCCEQGERTPTNLSRFILL